MSRNINRNHTRHIKRHILSGHVFALQYNLFTRFLVFMMQGHHLNSINWAVRNAAYSVFFVLLALRIHFLSCINGLHQKQNLFSLWWASDAVAQSDSECHKIYVQTSDRASWCVICLTSTTHATLLSDRKVLCWPVSQRDCCAPWHKYINLISRLVLTH